MRRTSVESSYNQELVNQLKEKVYHVGRWHMKGRRSDSTRIWKMMFRFIEEVLGTKYPFSDRAFIHLIIYPEYNRYSFMVQHHTATHYKGYIAKRENNYIKIVKALNDVLSHYNLILEETPESQKSNLNLHLSGRHREYEIKFKNWIIQTIKSLLLQGLFFL